MRELLQSFVVALDLVLRDEEDIIAQVSPEEWNDIHPSKHERRSTLLDLMKVRLAADIQHADHVTAAANNLYFDTT
jgi:hypothetical protein